VENSKHISKVQFQILSPPEGDAVILEFLDENDDAFMDISIDKKGAHQVTFYESKNSITFPLIELEKGIQLAKEKVRNVDVDHLFSDQE